MPVTSKDGLRRRTSPPSAEALAMLPMVRWQDWGTFEEAQERMRTEALDLAASESLWMYLWPIGLDGCSPGIHLNQNSPPGAMPKHTELAIMRHIRWKSASMRRAGLGP